MKKIVKLVLIIIILMSSVFSCISNSEKKSINKSRILYFALFPQGKTEWTYLFEIYNDKTMNTKRGIRNHIIKHEIEFYETEIKKTVILSTEDFDKITNIVKKIEEFGNTEIEGIMNDAWELIVITKTYRLHRYLSHYSDCDIPIYDLFLLISKISPIEIFQNW